MIWKPVGYEERRRKWVETRSPSQAVQNAVDRRILGVIANPFAAETNGYFFRLVLTDADTSGEQVLACWRVYPQSRVVEFTLLWQDRPPFNYAIEGVNDYEDEEEPLTFHEELPGIDGHLE